MLPIGYDEVAERDVSNRGEDIFLGGGLESDGTNKEDKFKMYILVVTFNVLDEIYLNTWYYNNTYTPHMFVLLNNNRRSDILTSNTQSTVDPDYVPALDDVLIYRRHGI